ncbi:MAG: 50S ribosomal protein L1 [Candidatus Aenigmarchaeota archaeon]|nr:50S ribosomal protein L1 [Candidatus Aenigmarchaeota archaeon]
MRDKILKALTELRNKTEKRKFSQSIDLIVSFKGLDLKKPESKFSEDLFLPNGRGDDADIVVFSDALTEVGCKVLNGSDIQTLATKKSDVKKLSAETDFFLAEAPLMPQIGRIFGQTLAPKNKMPKIIAGDVRKMVENYKRAVRLAVKSSPTIQCIVGKEKMDDGEIVDNVETVLKFLEGKLPRGRQNMNKVLLKFTMSKPVKIEVG